MKRTLAKARRRKGRRPLPALLFDAKPKKHASTRSTSVLLHHLDRQTTLVCRVYACARVCAHVHVHSLFGRLCGRCVSCVCAAVFQH